MLTVRKKKGGIWVRFSINLLQIKQLEGFEQKILQLWTCHLPTRNTHIIMKTNQVHAQIKYNIQSKSREHWLDLI